MDVSAEKYNTLVTWLLEGDVSIQYQTRRDLQEEKENKLGKLNKRIATEGWGKHFLDAQNPNGHWGRGFYMPKWISTHYTLLDLKNLCLPADTAAAIKGTGLAFELPEGKDGGVYFAVSIKYSDVCVNGMILNYGSYFMPEHPRLPKIVDFLLEVQMKDGGWNCEYYKGAVHSSFHSVIGVLEGLAEFLKSGNIYRETAIKKAMEEGIEFLLKHHLYKSHRTGEVVDPKMLMLSYPSRWKYDILRTLDFLQGIKHPYDKRIQDALDIIIKKQRADGKWPLQHKHSGLVHFDMEKTGGPSRWNTLRALRVLKHFNLL